MRPITITIILSVLFAFSLQAQQDPVKLIAPSIIIEEGTDMIDIPIKVESFTDIVGMQFSLRWDASVLEYLYVDSLNFGLDYLRYSSNFGYNDSDKGIMTFYWEDITFAGQSLNDGDSIFTIKAKVIGDAGTETMLEFSGDPTSIEFSDPNANILQYELINGMVGLPTVNAIEQAAIENARINLTPNPFREKTTLEFLLKESSETQISIYDLEGKKIYEESDWRSAGAQSVQLNRNLFSTEGIYLLELSTEEFRTTKKLFLVR